MKFPMNGELLSSVNGAHGIYVADLEAERETERQRDRELRKKEEREQKKTEKEKEEKVEENESLTKLEMKLNKQQTNLKVAEKSIKIGNQKLQEVFSEKYLSREKIQSTQAMIFLLFC